MVRRSFWEGREDDLLHRCNVFDRLSKRARERKGSEKSSQSGAESRPKSWGKRGFESSVFDRLRRRARERKRYEKWAESRAKVEPKVSRKVRENEASRSRCEDVSESSANQQELRSRRLKEPSIGLKKGLDLLDSLLVELIQSWAERWRLFENEG